MKGLYMENSIYLIIHREQDEIIECGRPHEEEAAPKWVALLPGLVFGLVARYSALATSLWKDYRHWLHISAAKGKARLPELAPTTVMDSKAVWIWGRHY